jgi:hypothetical protein
MKDTGIILHLSALGQKQTWQHVIGMSALCQLQTSPCMFTASAAREST